MKARLLFILFLLLHIVVAKGQIHSDFTCGTTVDMLRTTTAGGYSAYGAPFTPKGDLRILIICAGFGLNYDSQPVSGWDSTPNSLPVSLTDGSTFYSEYSQFTSNPPASALGNVSAYYYAMSRGQFRLVADVYPKRINITPGNEGWRGAANKVINQMKIENPGFDWSKYDKRKNSPGYQSDNRNTAPDKQPDYVVIVYRYARSFSNQLYYNYKLEPVYPPGDAHATTDLYNAISYNGYTFPDVNCGFTQFSGGSPIFNLFIHEVAHTLYDAPHVSYANAVIGNYFYGECGWSQMQQSFVPFVSSNAWERWYLDWIDGIKTNGVAADIKAAQDINATGEYTLRDCITTGDAIRIKLPNGSGQNQYLWLENHQGKSIFDNQRMTKDGCNNNLPSSPRGVVAFIESINDNKNNPGNNTFGIGANGLKFLHAAGNYDYTFPLQPELSCWWDNEIYNFHRQATNPIAGQTGSQFIKSDFNKNNVIDISTGENDVTALCKGDSKYFNRRDGANTYEFLNAERAFVAGRSLSMASNPCLINRPNYDSYNKKMGTYYLNGISVSILSYDAAGNARVKIKFNDVNIPNDTRYTGVIHLQDITGDANPDINIQSGYTLRIDKNGTPNRETKTAAGDFINPTEFRCLPNAYFKQSDNSKVAVENVSSLVLDDKVKYEVNAGAQLEIKGNSNLIINPGATLTIKSSGQFVVEKGSTLSVEKGAVIN